MLGLNSNQSLTPDPDDVTTFRIQRQTAENTPSSGAAPATGSGLASTAPVNATPTSAVPVTDTAAPVAAPVSDPAQARLTASVQTHLIRLGLYDGAADGKRGPRTDAAISAYQRRLGVPVTGAPSDDLLAALSIDEKSPAVRPKERPVQARATADDTIDPVAAAIRNAEKTVTTAQSTPTPYPSTAARPTPARLPAATPVSTGAASPANLAATAGSAGAEASLIMDIQRGLINIAYTDISVDGVAGDKTKAAIRHFERHYRLPETGEPNMAVLKKLKSIGAL
ncbi:MAG: peptidoglycan-binding protein [Gemmobacter sp.]